jgi:hypothetical protein
MRLFSSPLTSPREPIFASICGQREYLLVLELVIIWVINGLLMGSWRLFRVVGQ